MVDGNAGSQCVWNLHMSGNFLQTPLPMRMGDFQVHRQGDLNRIQWATLLEENLDRIEVQHTTQLNEFQSLGSVAAAGAAGRQQAYQHDHRYATWGWHYYRLKSIDHNGAESLSSIVSIFIDADDNDFSISPNPASDHVQIQSRATGNRELRILNVTGSVMQTTSWQGTGELETHALDITNLPPGLYFAEMHTTQGNIQAIRFLKH